MPDRGLYSLTVRNFGILGKVEVALGRLNVLVGPNGSGKSTLLRVIEFLGDAARLRLAPAVKKHGGLARLRTRRPRSDWKAHGQKISIEVKAVVTRYARPAALDEYRLDLRPVSASPDGSGAFAHKELFRFKRTQGQGRRITLEGGKLHFKDEESDDEDTVRNVSKEAFGLAVLPELAADEGGLEIRKIQELFTTFRVFDIDARKARAPSAEEESAPLAPDAANLAAFLAYLGAAHSDRFAGLLADARAIVPGLEDVELRRLGGPADAVTVDIRDKGLPGATPLAYASFGTVRALGLLAMLYDPAPPLLTCVEEIDHGLHPYAFDRLVELLRIAARKTQFLIATHSPALVNRLRPEELIVCERDEQTGLARIPAVDPSEVAAKAEASALRLGELWFSGALGGVPR